MVGASFNTINSIIGSGIIGVPAAIREAGFSVGVVLLVLIGVMSEYTLIILVSTANSVGCSSYQEVMRKAFGKIGYLLAAFEQFVVAFSGEWCNSTAWPLLDTIFLFGSPSSFLHGHSSLSIGPPLLSISPCRNGVLYHNSGRYNHRNNQWNM